jgi:hypothetical protein
VVFWKRRTTRSTDSQVNYRESSSLLRKVYYFSRELSSLRQTHPTETLMYVEQRMSSLLKEIREHLATLGE